MKKSVLLMIVFLIASATMLVRTQPSDPFGIGTFSIFQEAQEVPEPLIQPTSMSFVGDIMLARRVETYLDTYGNDYVYLDLPKLASATALVGNFEAAIPKEHVQTPDLTFSFSVDALVIPALADYGFSYISLANNHSLDKGVEDFDYTKEVLNNQGLQTFGTPDVFSSSSISYVDLADTSVALVGFHTLEKKPTTKEITEIMTAAGNVSDYQIAYMHWGNEYQPQHSASQQKLAHSLIDAGFDAVIGNHPHVVQDVEVYKNAPIFYSLGNFIFDQYFSTEVQEGLWLTLDFENDQAVYSLQGITSIGARSRPRFMAAFENDIFLKTLAKKSSSSVHDMIEKGVLRP